MVSKDAQDKIGRLQLLEQNLQQLGQQKQQLQSQLFEVESALKEVGTTTEAFKIIGNIMVQADPPTLAKELQQKKEMAELRVKTVDKQEEQIREKAESLRQDVLKLMKGEKNE